VNSFIVSRITIGLACVLATSPFCRATVSAAPSAEVKVPYTCGDIEAILVDKPATLMNSLIELANVDMGRD